MEPLTLISLIKLTKFASNEHAIISFFILSKISNQKQLKRRSRKMSTYHYFKLCGTRSACVIQIYFESTVKIQLAQLYSTLNCTNTSIHPKLV